MGVAIWDGCTNDTGLRGTKDRPLRCISVPLAKLLMLLAEMDSPT